MREGKEGGVEGPAAFGIGAIPGPNSAEVMEQPKDHLIRSEKGKLPLCAPHSKQIPQLYLFFTSKEMDFRLETFWHSTQSIHLRYWKWLVRFGYKLKQKLNENFQEKMRS